MTNLASIYRCIESRLGPDTKYLITKLVTNQDTEDDMAAAGDDSEFEGRSCNTNLDDYHRDAVHV